MFHPEGPSLLDLTLQALSSTRGGYDRLAPRFDVTPFRTPDVLLQAAGEVIARQPVARAVDLCCGTGAGVEMLRPLTDERVVGLDFSAGMLAQARRNLGLDGDGDDDATAVVLLEGDVLDPPDSLEGAFDVATCFGALGHIASRDEAAFVRSVRSLLRPGGRFVFVTGPMPSWRDRRLWVARGFNAVMRVRNALWRPQFVMYYLTFTLEDARRLLEAHDFTVHVHPTDVSDELRDAVVVEAVRG